MTMHKFLLPTLLLSLAFPLSLSPNAGAQTGKVTRVACVGDSITEGAGVANHSLDSYPSRLADLLGSSYEVKNFGRSGATMLKNGDKPYDQQDVCAAALAYKPDIVVIALGTNDSKPQNIEAHPNDFESSYLDLIAKFRAINPAVKIYICLPVPVYPENYGIRETVMLSKIDPLIRKVATTSHATLLDLHTPLIGKDRCFPDRVHPNEEGTLWIAQTVYQALTGRTAPPVFKKPVGITILPLGDSITVGLGDGTASGTAAGYRDRLAELLAQSGVKFQLLGSSNNQASKAIRALGQDFHEGHSGYTAADINANLDGFKQGPGNTSNDGYWMTGGHHTDREAIFPDIALLLAGTNDLGTGASETVMESRMSDLLEWFKENRPRSRVFVGTVPPCGSNRPGAEVFNASVVVFNKWLADKVQSLGYHFQLVDIHGLFIDSTGKVKESASPDGIFLKDGIHPSHNGYVAMGDLWFKAIKPSLK